MMLQADIFEKLNEFEVYWRLFGDNYWVDGLNLHPSIMESFLELLEINEKLHNT